jgi:hypothetical protein
MKNYKIISFWQNFDYNNNIFSNYFCKNYNLKEDIDNIDFIIIGSFVSLNDYNIIKNLKCIKVLCITEPIEFFYENTYKLYLENEFNFIIGTINNDIMNNKYKFPLYIPHIDYKDKSLFNDVNNYVKNCDTKIKKFCCLINTHDMKNTRTSIYNSLKEIDTINCPSNLFNNCSNEELNNIGNATYIKKYKFNICPENCFTNVNGYITEKILNCCLGGAIPIYYGWFDDIDEKIFNKNRILFYDPLNEESINIVKNKILLFLNNEDEFNNFYKQDVFCENAYQTIQDLDINLINMFNNLI